MPISIGVPVLSHVPPPIGVGQRDSTLESGTALGTARDSFSLKALIQARKMLSHQRDNVGQSGTNPEKMLSHCPDTVGQQKIAYSYHETASFPLTPDGLPDYAAWCADWWRGCFACPEFMPERVRFCRKWNRAVHGVDVVELSCQPAPRQETGRAWWCGRKEAAA